MKFENAHDRISQRVLSDVQRLQRVPQVGHGRAGEDLKGAGDVFGLEDKNTHVSLPIKETNFKND